MQDIVPIKMYEYMAVGKPVICTKLPGIMREFEEGNGVLYVESPAKVPEMAYTIVSNGSIKNHGNSSRSFVQNLDWNSITNRFEEFIFNLKVNYENKN